MSILSLARCANDDVRKKFQAFFDRYQKVVEDHKTNDLCDSQPTKGNIEGGLTTIEEKALGNIQKIGRKGSRRRLRSTRLKRPPAPVSGSWTPPPPPPRP